jgi:uncharacterized membrane protein
MMGFGFVWMVLLLFGVVALAMWLVQALFPAATDAASPPPRETTETPVAIARRRYAAGEITKEQFDEIVRGVS